MRVLPRVHAVRLGVHPVRIAEREQVVDRRGADAGRAAAGTSSPRSGRRPAALPAIRPGLAEAAPPCAPPVRLRRHDDEPLFDGDAVERLVDPALPRRRDGGERHDLVLGARFAEAPQHPQDVVADAGPGQRQRRDVDDDPHASGAVRQLDDERRGAVVREPRDALAHGVDAELALPVHGGPGHPELDLGRLSGGERSREGLGGEARSARRLSARCRARWSPSPSRAGPRGLTARTSGRRS